MILLFNDIRLVFTVSVIKLIKLEYQHSNTTYNMKCYHKQSNDTNIDQHDCNNRSHLLHRYCYETHSKLHQYLLNTIEICYRQEYKNK